MLTLYQRGGFVMPSGVSGLYAVYSPQRRGVLPLENLRVTRSLRKSMKRYEVSLDHDFAGVVRGCASRQAPTDWIDGRLAALYHDLHTLGHAHSVEVWDETGVLTGGLFVVNVGGLVSGESMFHIGRDASKTALAWLVHHLRDRGTVLLDTQWSTPHLADLGVIEIPRAQYLRRLAEVVSLPDVL
jgi:leucyl/phenylalanyl-tRNA--protein transferase